MLVIMAGPNGFLIAQIFVFSSTNGLFYEGHGTTPHGSLSSLLKNALALALELRHFVSLFVAFLLCFLSSQFSLLYTLYVFTTVSWLSSLKVVLVLRVIFVLSLSRLSICVSLLSFMCCSLPVACSSFGATSLFVPAHRHTHTCVCVCYL